MKFQGTIIEVSPLLEMTINDKPSKKIEFLLEYEGGQFSKNIVVEVWNDKVDNPNIIVGNKVAADANLKSRKVGEIYFNNITANKIDLTE